MLVRFMQRSTCRRIASFSSREYKRSSIRAGRHVKVRRPRRLLPISLLASCVPTVPPPTVYLLQTANIADVQGGNICLQKDYF